MLRCIMEKKKNLKIHIESDPMIDSAAVLTYGDELLIDSAAVVVDGEEPEMVEPVPVIVNPAKVNYTEILYWSDGQKAREFTYGDYGSLIKSTIVDDGAQAIYENGAIVQKDHISGISNMEIIHRQSRITAIIK
ncbi:hypothetical protein FQR65_LT17039 [Abscondita terminalis]|nr:hypothetical protein FQR65_LT17039 [Abscondita terminalis]